MIFPIPKYFCETDGSYTFKSDIPDDSLMSFYHSLISGDEVELCENSSLSEEEYTIVISTEKVKLSFSSMAGRFRAITSLYQLYFHSGKTISCAEICDCPDFERRGYMLDISGGRMPKVDTIKCIIDYLALLKYNEFQLCMQGFNFKFPLIPAVTEGFECLNKDDIQEINLYCKERFIELVPLHNSFGHMISWLSRKEYRHLAVGDEKVNTGTINPLLPESKKLISDIFDSLLPYFDSKYVNVGFDEAEGLGKYQLADLSETDVFMDHLNYINDNIASKYGKKVQFWSDMIINHPDCFDKIPEGAVALEWGYDLIQSQMMGERCALLEENNVNFYVCPSCNTHVCLTGRGDVTTFNLRTAGELGKKHKAKGYLLTDWTCGYEGHPHFLVWSFFPLALAGQYSWNVGKEQTGEALKPEYIYAAKDFVDLWQFGGARVSEYLYRLSNYYLLEPERVHLGSMCGLLQGFPLDCLGYFYFFDLKKCGDDFYFDNVINYVSSTLKDIEKIDFNARYKREIILNTRMVILYAELCKVRMHQSVDALKADELFKMFDSLIDEMTQLWLYRNYEKGMEICINNFKNRKKELAALVSNNKE